MRMQQPGLRGEELHLGYSGREVVAGASIEIDAGQVTALVGPNGSGKSTLLRGLARLHRPDAGRIGFPGGGSALDLSASEFARRVTLLTQSRPTPGGVSVRDVVGYGRHPYRGRWRHDDPGDAAAIDHAMTVTGVTAMADRGVDELSGGELQRVWLATCVAQPSRRWRRSLPWASVLPCCWQAGSTFLRWVTTPLSCWVCRCGVPGWSRWSPRCCCPRRP